MRWNELTAPEFVTAIETCGRVCLLPLGVIEKHGDHLPIGIDYMKAWHYADSAAQQETAMVFPPCYIGAVGCASHCPGTIALPLPMVMAVLENICSEIARNGFKKIILVNAHGGNISLLQTLVRMQMDSPRDYVLYLCSLKPGQRTVEALERMHEETGGAGGHADAYETAVSLHLFPELVKMDRILPPEAGEPLKRQGELRGKAMTPMFWYADHPEHLAGYGGKATGEHGRKVCKAIADDIAEIISLVKQDKVSDALQQEFYRKKANPCGF